MREKTGQGKISQSFLRASGWWSCGASGSSSIQLWKSALFDDQIFTLNAEILERIFRDHKIPITKTAIQFRNSIFRLRKFFVSQFYFPAILRLQTAPLLFDVILRRGIRSRFLILGFTSRRRGSVVVVGFHRQRGQDRLFRHGE